MQKSLLFYSAVGMLVLLTACSHTRTTSGRMRELPACIQNQIPDASPQYFGLEYNEKLLLKLMEQNRDSLAFEENWPKMMRLRKPGDQIWWWSSPEPKSGVGGLALVGQGCKVKHYFIINIF